MAKDSAPSVRVRSRPDHLWVDDSQFPVIYLRLPEQISEDDVSDLYDYLKLNILRKRMSYGVVVDATGLRSVPSAAVRQRLADHEHAVADIESRYNKANAYVIASAVLRGALTAIYWVSPPRYPHAVFPSTDRAEAWVRSKLIEAGIRL